MVVVIKAVAAATSSSASLATLTGGPSSNFRARKIDPSQFTVRTFHHRLPVVSFTLPTFVVPLGREQQLFLILSAFECGNL